MAEGAACRISPGGLLVTGGGAGVLAVLVTIHIGSQVGAEGEGRDGAARHGDRGVAVAGSRSVDVLRVRPSVVGMAGPAGRLF